MLGILAYFGVASEEMVLVIAFVHDLDVFVKEEIDGQSPARTETLYNMQLIIRKKKT